jgi:hypothetical protein
VRVLREKLQRVEAAAGDDVSMLQALGLREYTGIDSDRGRYRKVLRVPEFEPVDDPSQEDPPPAEIEPLGARFLYNREIR